MNILVRRSLLSFAATACALATAVTLSSCHGGPFGPEYPSVDFTGQAGGCGNIYVYRGNKEGTSYLIVSADREKLGLSTQAVTFDLATPREGLAVRLDLYAGRPQSLSYCNDVLVPNDVKPAIWTAVAGRVTIQLSKDNPTPPDFLYKATAEIKGGVFRSPDGTQLVTVPSVTIPDVMVGWMAG